MTRWTKWPLGVAGVLLVGLLGGVVIDARIQADHFVTNPMAARHIPATTPADAGLAYQDATVVTADGLKLVGWYLPGATGRVIVVLHGYKDYRAKYLDVSSVFLRHGYSVMLPALRAHDRSDGDTITFGVNETKDLDAWFAYLRARPDVDAARIGVFGVSMGGAIGIDYASRHGVIRAIAADSAFSSTRDTIATSVRHFTGLPPFPFAPLMLFWADHDTGAPLADIDAKKTIAEISPRAVLLMQGGADTVISLTSGVLLYQAAGEPKELWFEPSLGHAQFFKKLPREFERRVVGFFDRYLGD